MSSGLPGWNTWRDQQGLDEHGRPKATGGNGGSSATRMFFFTPASPPTMHQPKVSGGATALPPTGLFTGPATQLGGGAAHSSHRHSTHLKRLTKEPEMGVVRHVFCMVQLSCGSFLLVQGTDGDWGPPGGNVKKGEISWNAAKREFKEETNSSLPRLDGQPLGSTTDEPLKYHWAHRSSITGFYCGCTSSSFRDFSLNFRASREIISVGAFTVQELWQMVHGTHVDFTLRPCAIESTCALLIELGFPERS